MQRDINKNEYDGVGTKISELYNKVLKRTSKSHEKSSVAP
jgi:hypothetical protein